MRRTVGDLRAMLDQESRDAPPETGRMAAVEGKIRTRRRRRTATTAVTAVAAVVLVAAGAVAGPFGREDPRPGHGPAAGPTAEAPEGPPPAVFQGMRRIVSQQFTVTGEMMSLRFTPTGRDTAYIIQCRPGFEVVQQVDGDGGYGAFGECAAGAAPSRAIMSGLGGRRLQPGVPHLLEVVVLPEGTVKRNAIEYMRGVAVGRGTPTVTLEEYLATHEPGMSPWTVAVYSGMCSGDC
ncbi:hypothetical protein [Spirillospora sp. NPDC047279]|uniref:hypothetical protein n=1 Tax=Spirillospora sp. NPDC047279 TaxID=3155478 RepID=UPI0033CC453C